MSRRWWLGKLTLTDCFEAITEKYLNDHFQCKMMKEYVNWVLHDESYDVIYLSWIIIMFCT